MAERRITNLPIHINRRKSMNPWTIAALCMLSYSLGVMHRAVVYKVEGGAISAPVLFFFAIGILLVRITIFFQ